MCGIQFAYLFGKNIKRTSTRHEARAVEEGDNFQFAACYLINRLTTDLRFFQVTLFRVTIPQNVDPIPVLIKGPSRATHARMPKKTADKKLQYKII